MLSSTYGEAALSAKTCHEWFQRFKIGVLDDENQHGGGKEKIGRIIGSDSTSHFETPQSHGNDSEAGKLGSIRVEVERC